MVFFFLLWHLVVLSLLFVRSLSVVAAEALEKGGWKREGEGGEF